MAKALMIQGTGSGAGKSLVTAGLCRILSDMGINVSPFKAQNMALNSFITEEGAEIGRAQALQAEAARIKPSVDMNPILLKATGEAQCQVIVKGSVHSNMKAKDYYAFKEEAWGAVKEAYERLSGRHDLILIEGAGSPAEINLMDDEIVNMRVARHVNAPVLLIGDIDRGGVFASFYGTLGLLNEDAGYIKAFIINKFRGDISVLEPALKMIQDKTGRPVIGVIPYLGDLGLHEEDGIPLERLKQPEVYKENSQLKVVVLKLRYISNFTDFDPFMYEPDVELSYSLNKADIEKADLLIIPGSKNTIHDLLFLRQSGMEQGIKNAEKKGIPIIGICGGYQMLGKKIKDPLGIEGDIKEIEGIGLLDVETEIHDRKITSQVEAEIISSGLPPSTKLRGYEIHMGITKWQRCPLSKGDTGVFKLTRLSKAVKPGVVLDGSMKGSVWGTYIHGIFDNDDFREGLLNILRGKKGLNIPDAVNYQRLKDNSLNKWAGLLRETLNMEFIKRLLL